MGKTKIEWCDATWSPVTGCTKVSSGCAHCYAERMSKRFGWPWKVTLHHDRLDQPLHWRKPRKVFVCSMGDLFHKDVPRDFIDDVIAVMAQCAQHNFLILTKRPARMLEFFADPIGKQWQKPILGNLWLGVSVEDQATADERIPLLLKTPAAVRFVSYEPALGPVDFDGWLPIWRCQECGEAQSLDPSWRWAGDHWQHHHGYHAGHLPAKRFPGLDHVIVGGESGPGARPMHPDWARSVRDQCVAAGVPFFLKQMGEWLHAEETIMGEMNGRHEYLGADLMVRVGKKAAGRLLDGVLHDDYPPSP